MNRAKKFNEFVNESLWSRVKGAFGNRHHDHQEETYGEEDPEESSDREYREIVD